MDCLPADDSIGYDFGCPGIGVLCCFGNQFSPNRSTDPLISGYPEHLVQNADAVSILFVVEVVSEKIDLTESCQKAARPIFSFDDQSQLLAGLLVLAKFFVHATNEFPYYLDRSLLAITQDCLRHDVQITDLAIFCAFANFLCQIDGKL